MKDKVEINQSINPGEVSSLDSYWRAKKPSLEMLEVTTFATSYLAPIP